MLFVRDDFAQRFEDVLLIVCLVCVEFVLLGLCFFVVYGSLVDSIVIGDDFEFIDVEIDVMFGDFE